ncbi:TetR/AcrR family transcriptional regulator [Nocardia farcinica]|nr:TetR/AcrR family transcriptional regulator [Nocardia farcinica]MBA4858112.1 TetR/AcrR family transcriptional regulator [Nocardia farcinica]MBC9816642.1 TetR/AcrR family transcriptional regulator [Nocardia farcinica]MBF6293954.1 TetR/AcrR family transcriptional regulator [Nocardia farcinica]MBF6380371.1 TetR/AcrR family transcriptional regulator [Nocardia farcinica]
MVSVRRVDPERVARKREQIVVEAARLFGTRGYERTSVADIARAAGVSAASVFYYFTDKAAVFRAVFERDLPVVESLIAKHVHSRTPVPAIFEVVDELAKDAADASAPGMVVELLRRAEHDPELVAVVAQTAEVVTGGLAALIARGIADGEIDAELDPVETARWLQAIVDAAYLNARSGYSPLPELRRTVLRYLGAHERQGDIDG